MCKVKVLFSMLAIVSVGFVCCANAANRTIHFQGKLMDESGNLLNGSQTVTFRLYNALSGGTQVGSNMNYGVECSSGLFNVELGKYGELNNVSFSCQYWADISFDGGVTSLSPRQPLGSSGYAQGSLGDFNIAGSLYSGPSYFNGKLTVGDAGGYTGSHAFNHIGVNIEDYGAGWGQYQSAIVKIKDNTPPIYWGDRCILRVDNSGGDVFRVMGDGTTFTAGNANINGSSIINGNSTINGSSTINGNVGIAGNVNFGGGRYYSDSLVDIKTDNDMPLSITNMSSSNGTYSGLKGVAWHSAHAALYTTGSIKFYRNDDWGGSMALCTTNNYGAWDIERVRIDRNGNVGIGTASPRGTLDVNGSVWSSAGYISSSDERLKSNIKTASANGIFDKLGKVNAIRYKLNRNEMKKMKAGAKDMAEYEQKIREDIMHQSTDTVKIPKMIEDRKKSDDESLKFCDEDQIGVSAQEMEAQFPELVKTDSNGYKGIAYDRLSVILLQAVKEQQVQMNDMKAEIEALKTKINKSK